MRSMALLLALTLAVGCAYEREPLPVSQAVPPDTPAPAQAATADKAVSDQVLALTGPGGIVRLGDPMEQAKKAFPIPKGAEQDDGPAVFGDSSYSWSHPQTSESFGANGRSGKVAFLAYSLGANAKPEALASKAIQLLGEPSGKATHPKGYLYVWEAGENARFLAHLEGGLFEAPVIFIGPKEEMRAMNLHYDHPDVWVQQIELAEKLKPVFDEAKRKAKEKAGSEEP